MSRPLRVMIDARMLLGRFSGVARVVTRLVDGLCLLDDLRVLVLCGTVPYEPWSCRKDIEVVSSSFGPHDRGPVRRLLWEELKLPGVIRAANVDLFHATWNTGIPARVHIPTVLTIHDLIPWPSQHQHFQSALGRACYRFAQSYSARRSTLITTVSDHVRRQVIDILDVAPGKIATVPNGVDAPQSGHAAMPAGTQAPEPDIGRYILYVGGHEPRKNVAGVFQAMNAYWLRSGDPMRLCLTGHASSLCPEAAAAFAALEHQHLVEFLGQLDDESLARAYAGASLFLFLSREEGFGLPVLEAMAHRCPVVAANRSSLPEVVGDAGILVHPDRPEEAASAIARIFHDESLRNTLIKRGLERASGFGWARMVQRLRQIYEQALNGRFHEPIHAAQPPHCLDSCPIPATVGGSGPPPQAEPKTVLAVPAGRQKADVAQR